MSRARWIISSWTKDRRLSPGRKSTGKHSISRLAMNSCMAVWTQRLMINGCPREKRYPTEWGLTKTFPSPSNRRSIRNSERTPATRGGRCAKYLTLTSMMIRKRLYTNFLRKRAEADCCSGEYSRRGSSNHHRQSKAKNRSSKRRILDSSKLGFQGSLAAELRELCVRIPTGIKIKGKKILLRTTGEPKSSARLRN